MKTVGRTGIVALVVAVGLAFLASPAFAKGTKTKKPHDAKAAFQRLDKDKDGKLSRAEFVGSHKKPEGRAKAEKKFAKLDKHHNGHITFEKFKEYYDKAHQKKK